MTPRTRARQEVSAGGVVVRHGDGGPLVLLIRDSYDNWGFPKGHLEPGEAAEAAALREVSEETGLARVTSRGELRTIDWYFRFRGRLIHKVCHFFLMETGDADTCPQRAEGITACRWAPFEEALRLDAPAQFMVRTCQHATELEGAPLERGQRVFMCIGSANHDDAVFDDADSFRLDRESRDHLSFGAGSHICAGATLARLEVRTLLRSFLDRVVAFHLADPDHFEPRASPMSQGPIDLVVVIDEVER